MGSKTNEFAKLAIEKDPTLVPKVLEMFDRITARDKAHVDADGCPACEFLLQVCEDGQVVCKMCGRDDYIERLGGNDLSLEEDSDG